MDMKFLKIKGNPFEERTKATWINLSQIQAIRIYQSGSEEYRVTILKQNSGFTAAVCKTEEDAEAYVEYLLGEIGEA